jgi:hypothetical protein
MNKTNIIMYELKSYLDKNDFNSAIEMAEEIAKNPISNPSPDGKALAEVVLYELFRYAVVKQKSVKMFTEFVRKFPGWKEIVEANDRPEITTEYLSELLNISTENMEGLLREIGKSIGGEFKIK